MSPRSRPGRTRRELAHALLSRALTIAAQILGHGKDPTMHATSTRLATLSATAVLLGAAACQADVESDGELAVTLLGNSNSGAVYRLPEGSILDVANSEFQDGFSLDGDATSVRLDLPVGDYDA